MIVDTSALVAIVKGERGEADLLMALGREECVLPAPVLVEFHRVTSGENNLPTEPARLLIARLRAQGAKVVPFTDEDASLAVIANVEHGTGNGRGGPLNMLDLMVLGMARRLGLPILCTGNDFADAGAPIHPASRVDRL